MNKDKELAILKMVYDLTHFESVHQQESPDFALQYPNVEMAFGVEITELYCSESDARLKNNPWYTDQLLNGGAYMHRKDAKDIQVDTISFFTAEGTVYASDVMAVVSRRPSSDVYAELLASIIDGKNNKLNEYGKGLSHINLIVADMDYFFSFTAPDELYKYLFTPSLKKVIINTGFHEVFLVTQVKQDCKVFIPLRMLLTLGQINLFDWAIGEHYPDLIYRSSNVRMKLFAEFLIKLGHKITLRQTDKGLGIQVGRSIIRADWGENITVLDCMDRPISNKTLAIGKGEHSSKLNDTFLAFYEKYCQENTFKANVAFDVVK